MLIAHLTDLHIRPHGLPAYRVVETNMFAERAVAALMRLDPLPDVVVISGDLADNGLIAEYEVLKRLLDRLAMPVWLVPGNHDRRENLKTVLAGYPGLAQHDTFAQWTADLGPLRMIGLDTVKPGSGAGALCGQRLAWFADRLAEDPAKPTVVVMHHPPFACGVRLMDQIMLLEGAREFAGIVRANSQIVRILCGHHHRPIQTLFAGTLAQIGPGIAHQVVLDFKDTAEPNFNFEPAAFHLHAWSEAAGLVSHTAYVETAPGPYPFLPDPDYPGRIKAG